MSDRVLRLSRRRLLQVSSVAPLTAVLLACGTHEEIAAVAKKLPVKTEDDLWEKSKDVLGAHEANFRIAARVLWEYFAAGAEDAGITVPESGEKHRHLVLKVAYEQKNLGGEMSGVLIAKRSQSWRNEMHATTACAYLCGAKSALAATAGEIDENAYATGFKDVADVREWTEETCEVDRQGRADR